MQTLPYADILSWVEEYAHLGVDRLLMGANDVPKELRRYVAEQIALRPAIRSKLPSYAERGLYVARGINLEQCSSEGCARFKAELMQEHRERVMDLTGGLGIDFLALSDGAQQAVYLECNAETYSAAEYNLPRLSRAASLHLYHTDAESQLHSLITEHRPTLLYLDPARRSDLDEHKRVYGIEDCSPNLLAILEGLRQMPTELLPQRVLVKLSPMLDIRHTLSQVDHLEGVYIVAYRGEVKELLLAIDVWAGRAHASEEVPICAVNLHPTLGTQTFTASWQQEQSLSLPLCSTVGAYLYEPNAAVMKSGLFASLAHRYTLCGLHPNSHLFTSDEVLPDFPGRAFRLEEIIPYQSSLIKRLKKRIPEAMISCRNFPLRPDALRQKLGIRDAGERTLFATTLLDGSLVLLLVKPIHTA